MKCIYCDKEIDDNFDFCPHCGGNQKSLEGYPGAGYWNDIYPILCLSIVTLVLFLFFSWTNDTTSIFKWKGEALFWFLIIEVPTIFACWKLRKDMWEEHLKKHERWTSLTKKKFHRDFYKYIKEYGGIELILKNIINGLGFPIEETGETWVKLKISDNSSIKIEKIDKHRQNVTFIAEINKEPIFNKIIYSDEGWEEKITVEKIQKEMKRIGLV